MKITFLSTFLLKILVSFLCWSTPALHAKEAPLQKGHESSGENTDKSPAIKPENMTLSSREDLREKLFSGINEKPACLLVSTDPKLSIENLDKSLQNTLDGIASAVEKMDSKTLTTYFHPRLNFNPTQIERTLKVMQGTYGKKMDLSNFRLWALDSWDGSTKGLSCSDGLTIYPLYGYPLQIATWIQINGPKELGRLYVALVPEKDKWYIGAFHSQQWTHASKDFLAWYEQAKKLKPTPKLSYLAYDIAAKLLDGGGFVDTTDKPIIKKEQRELLSYDQWLELVKKDLSDYKVIYASSIFAEGGAGVFVRIREKGEISLRDMEKNCKDIATTLKAKDWANFARGVRCGFHLPHEDAKKEGAMGSLYTKF